MTIGFDDATPATLNGVTEVQINGALPLTTPDKASQILEVVPYWGSRGAFTIDEGIMPFMRIQSDDVSITPKSFSLPVAHLGTAGTPATVSLPPLQTMPLNIDLSQSRQSRINYFANDQIDATVEPAVGATVVYDTDPVTMPEQFYQKPDNEFVGSGTDGTRVTSVSAMTITGGREINMFILQVVLQASALSEQVFGFMEFSSSDFLTSMPYRMAYSGSSAGVGVAGGEATVNTGKGIQIYNLPIGKGVPIAGRTVLDLAITTFDGNATGPSAVGGVGYIK